MSGGSLNYAYSRVDDLAYEVDRRATTAKHRAFAAHLRLVAKALHDCEWVWSGDDSPGDENSAIDAVVSPAAELAAATDHANEALQQLAAAIERAKGVQL